MATHGHNRSFDTLVDLQQGVISREIFVNADIYQQEQEQVFARSWLFVGHESQIPNPGDYFTSCMAEESVLLVRDNRDAIHVFLISAELRPELCRYRSVDLVSIGPSGRGRRDDERVATQNLNLAFPGRGHCALAYLQTEDTPYIPTYKNSPEIEAYFKHQYEERQRRLGDQARLLGRVGTVFPNMSFLSRQPRSIAVWHPRGAMQTEAWRFFLVDKDAPQAVKDMLRHYYMRYSGPGGLTEQDDMENWNYASAASQGTIARRYAYNYQMGLGFEAAHETLPGLASQGYSEQNQRIFYQQWANLMAGRSWDRLVAR